MGIRPRNVSNSPKGLLFTGASPHNKVLVAPPENLVAVANAQAFSTLAANHPGRGLTNSMLLNGTGTCAVIDRDSVDRDVQLPIPWIIAINCVASANTPLIRITGYDQFGRKTVETGRKSNTSAIYYTGQKVWSVINTIEFLEAGGIGAADTPLVGFCWKIADGTTRPFVVPWDVQEQGVDVGGVVIVKGAGTVSDVATDGSVCLVAQTAGVEDIDYVGRTTNRTGAVNIQITADFGVAPATPILYSVFPRGQAYQKF